MRYACNKATSDNENRSCTRKGMSIRLAAEGDEDTLAALAEAEGMEGIRSFDDTLVAQADASIAGFCRIRMIDGSACVNPIVISPPFRKCGIGRLLMNAALSRYGTLTFVSRGESIGFYESIGCTNCPWNEIPEELAQDCASCVRKDSCHPKPMIMRRREESPPTSPTS